MPLDSCPVLAYEAFPSRPRVCHPTQTMLWSDCFPPNRFEDQEACHSLCCVREKILIKNSVSSKGNMMIIYPFTCTLCHTPRVLHEPAKFLSPLWIYNLARLVSYKTSLTSADGRLFSKKSHSPSTKNGISVPLTWPNPLCIGCDSVDSNIATVAAVHYSRWPVAIVKAGCLPVAHAVSCTFPCDIRNYAIPERSDETCCAAFVFHVHCNTLKIGWEVEAVKINMKTYDSLICSYTLRLFSSLEAA